MQYETKRAKHIEKLKNVDQKGKRMVVFLEFLRAKGATIVRNISLEYVLTDRHIILEY